MSPATASDAALYKAAAADALANSPLVKAVTLSKNPVGYWRLNETSGTTARDSSGNGYDGTISGSGVTLGISGALPGDPNDTAAAFSGGTVIVGYRAALNPAHFTAACWVLRSSTPAANAAMLDCRPANSGANAAGFLLGIGGPSGVASLFTDAANQTQSSLQGGVNICDGHWHHIAGAYDGTNGTVWVDGVKVNGPAAMVYTQNPTVSLTIGRNVLGGEGFFTGSIKDALVAPLLSATDISDLYLVGKNALAALATTSEVQL